MRAAASALVVLALLAGGCGDDTPAAEPAPTTMTAAPTTVPTTTAVVPTTTADPARLAVAALVDELTVEDRIAQLLVTGVVGADPGATLATVASPCVGGVFVTESNENWWPLDDPDAATAAIAGIGAAASDCAVAPLIATDAEAGRVLRVPVPPLDEPAELAARRADPTTAAKVEVEASRFVADLAALGVHVNLGVVADVDLDPGFFMARSRRTFGADPATVADLSGALVAAHCEGGLAATLKHFPNQGAAAEDPHRVPGAAQGGEPVWRTTGRIPYVATPAPMVMVGHVSLAPDGAPASLSRYVIESLLRDDLEFGGVVISDDLVAMEAVAAAEPDLAARVLGTLAAGTDLALTIVPDAVPAVIASGAERYRTDPFFAATVDQSLTRVLELKAGLGLLADVDPAWFPLCADPQ